MEKYLIGYKQGNGEYVYVNSINDYSINVTLNNNNAIDFITEEIAKNVCEYVNMKDTEKTYLPLLVKVDITEIIENEIIEETIEEAEDNDTITNE